MATRWPIAMAYYTAPGPRAGRGAVGSALLANLVANLSAWDRGVPAGSPGTRRTRWVAKRLVGWGCTRSGSTGRTALLTLSRWRHGPEAELTAPTPDEFRAAIMRGEIRGTPELFVLGKMNLAGFAAAQGS